MLLKVPLSSPALLCSFIRAGNIKKELRKEMMLTITLPVIF